HTDPEPTIVRRARETTSVGVDLGARQGGGEQDQGIRGRGPGLLGRRSGEGSATAMRQVGDAGRGGGSRGPGASPRDLAVSRRRGGLAPLRQAMLGGAGTVLITGEPGSGKTWLWRKSLAELPGHWRSVCVDMSAALDALEFLRLIAAGLELPVPDRLGAA